MRVFTFTRSTASYRIMEMLKSVLAQFSLLFMFLGTVAAQVLPDLTDPPPSVDMITPVPMPEIPFGSSLELQPMLPQELKLTNQGGRIEGNVNSFVRLGGPIKIEGDNGMEVFSDTALLDVKGKLVTLEGHVTVYQGNILQRGDRAVYHYDRKFLDTNGMRVLIDSVVLEAGRFTVEDRGGKRVYVGEDVGVATNDEEHPNYWVRAKKTTIYPRETIKMEDLHVYLGGVPVFWLPYLSQTLDPKLGYHFLPGTHPSWGPFLLNNYGMMLGGEYSEATQKNEGAWLYSLWHLDIRGNRGLGAGVDLSDTRKKHSNTFTGLEFYFLNDLAPETNNTGVARESIDENRYRIRLRDRTELEFPDDAAWRLDSNLTFLSDRYFLEDFETSAFRTDPAPDNMVGIFRRDDLTLLSIVARLRIDDFYRTDTRAPEVSFDQARAPLFGLPVLHEGSTSFGFIGEEASDLTTSAIINPLMGLTLADAAARPLLDQLSSFELTLAERLLALPLGDSRRGSIRRQLLDSGYSRFRTFQEVSMPMTLGGYLNFTPQAGVGYTRYGDSDGPQDALDRTYLYAGAESSMKFSKEVYASKEPRWGTDELLHVFQPYCSWSVVSTNDLRADEPAVDRLTPTTRPQPLDPLHFAAVDDMRSWNILRFGARNRLLTKRDGQSFEWLYLNTYMDTFIKDPEERRTISNLHNDVRWQPLPWFGVNLETQFPIVDDGTGFTEFDSRMHFMPTPDSDLSIGYRRLGGHPEIQDSNQFNLQTYTRLADTWGFGTQHVFAIDQGILQFQQYTLHHDFGNWIATLGLSNRNNIKAEEFGVLFSLTLKDFPAISLPFEIGQKL